MAIGEDGQPAKGIGLTVWGPGSGSPDEKLLHTQANEGGEYRFENLAPGEYRVCADDQDAGYAPQSTLCSAAGHPAEVVVTVEHPEAELRVYLPPKAAFLTVRLVNRATGAEIPQGSVSWSLPENPRARVFEAACGSNAVVLVPPDKDLLLHVTADGFREWEESAEAGKPIRLHSGTRRTLDRSSTGILTSNVE